MEIGQYTTGPAMRGGVLLPTLAGIVSGVGFGTVPSLSLYLLQEGLTVHSLLFWRFILALALTLPFVLWTGWRSQVVWHQGWKLILVGAIVGGLQSYCFFTSIEFLPTSTAVLIMYTFPALTLLADRLLYGVLLTRTALIAAALILGGAVAITMPGLRMGQISPWGLMWILPVPFLYTAYLMLNARLMLNKSSVASAFFLYVGLVTVFGIAVIVHGLESPISPAGWGILALVAICGGFIAMTLFSYSISRLGGSHYGVLSCIELATAVLIGAVALQEPLRPIQLLGVAVVVAGVTLRSVRGVAS